MGQSRPHQFRTTALVVERDGDQRSLVAVLLEEVDMRVVECESAEAAERVMQDVEIDFLFTDMALGGVMNGVELARAAKKRKPSLPVVVASEEPCAGLPPATRFMRKPWVPLDVLMEAERAVA